MSLPLLRAGDDALVMTDVSRESVQSAKFVAVRPHFWISSRFPATNPPDPPRKMKTDIPPSPRSRHLPSAFARLTWKPFFAVVLTLAVHATNGQSMESDDTDQPVIPTSWVTGPALPSPAVRAAGTFFPANGAFYVMGGRSTDTAGSDFTRPFEYNPGSNSWATKVGTYPDNQVNNMACGVLTVGGTPQIYCVGGSAAGATTATARVFSYNPVTDLVTPLTAADNWPGNLTGGVLPGGFAVAGNKLYIIGGFNINVGMTQQTWQFDPNAAVGSRWLQRLDYPVERGYIPAAAIGGFIYTAGGALWDGTTLQDSADSFKYDVVANTWSPIATIPRETGETRALAINNRMWVIGGGRTAPNPSTQVDIYNPTTDAWTTGLPLALARRNFPTDTDGSRVWLGGGYAPTTPTNTMEIFTVPVPIGAFSRKFHGALGPFDIPLPGVECRSTGGNHVMVVTFGAPVTLTGASVTSVVGSVGSFSQTATEVTVNLTGVANAQRITVTLANVNDGTTTGDVAIPMGVLAGDINGGGSVNATDIGQVKAQSGLAASATNFRTDVNASGSITATDIGQVKSLSGTSIP